MSVNLRYALRNHDITTLLNWSVQTGTEVVQYEADHIGTDVIARPAKIAETTGAWLADCTARPGGKQRVDAIVLPMHNLTAGLQVRIKGNATNSWGSPTFNQLITIPTYRDDGFPIGPFLDLTGLASYTSLGFAYWLVHVVGTNGAPVAIKVKLLEQLQTLSPNISWGAAEEDDRKLIEHETDYGVSSIYDLAVTRRMISGDLDSPDTQRLAIRALWQSTRGRVYPFVIVPNGDVNDAWFVRFTDPKLGVILNMIDRNSIKVGFQEVSRGLVL